MTDIEETDKRAQVERYGRLTLLRRDAGRSGDGRVKSLWRCDCGEDALIAYGRVKNGDTASCGCFARERSSKRATTHGMRGTPEYSCWIAMRRRCLSPIDKDYPRYGGRGIKICPAWSSFATFLSDMGPRPVGMTLDRVNGSGDYEPGNVQWATAKQQGRNRRGTFDWHIRGAVFGSITEAAQKFDVSEQTVTRWVNGQFDKRRGRAQPPRPDCHVVERYSA